MSATVDYGLATSTANTTAPLTRADSAVADYSRDGAAQLAVMRTDANRDDMNFAGHRPTEVTPLAEAA